MTCKKQGGVRAPPALGPAWVGVGRLAVSRSCGLAGVALELVPADGRSPVRRRQTDLKSLYPPPDSMAQDSRTSCPSESHLSDESHLTPPRLSQAPSGSAFQMAPLGIPSCFLPHYLGGRARWVLAPSVVRGENAVTFCWPARPWTAREQGLLGSVQKRS